MEAAALFTMGNLYGFRSGCLCVAVANRITNEMVSSPLEPAMATCNRAIQILCVRDAKKRASGKKYWTPRHG